MFVFTLCTKIIASKQPTTNGKIMKEPKKSMIEFLAAYIHHNVLLTAGFRTKALGWVVETCSQGW